MCTDIDVSPPTQSITLSRDATNERVTRCTPPSASTHRDGRFSAKQRNDVIKICVERCHIPAGQTPQARWVAGTDMGTGSAAGSRPPRAVGSRWLICWTGAPWMPGRTPSTTPWGPPSRPASGGMDLAGTVMYFLDAVCFPPAPPVRHPRALTRISFYFAAPPGSWDECAFLSPSPRPLLLT
jgi:hypothetical protein